MAGSAWDATRACCVDLPASFPLQSFATVEEATNTGVLAADMYLRAVRQASATSEVSRFNGLMLNADYRGRFLDAYPTGTNEGMQAAIDEILTEVDSVLQAVYLAMEAVAADPQLQDDVIASAGAMWLRPAGRLSDSQSNALDARLVNVQKRLLPGFAQAPNVGSIPFSGMRESTRGVMQAISSLQVWRGAITAPGKLSLGGAAIDTVFQSSQAWSDIFVGAEDDVQTLFSVVTTALMQMNCDPAGQGYNLGWVVGYMAFWVTTIVLFEGIVALESPF